MQGGSLSLNLKRQHRDRAARSHLILRSRAKRGVSKDGDALRCSPSFETPASPSARRAPQDEAERKDDAVIARSAQRDEAISATRVGLRDTAPPSFPSRLEHD